jgi:hypothetical protein
MDMASNNNTNRKARTMRKKITKLDNLTGATLHILGAEVLGAPRYDVTVTATEVYLCNAWTNPNHGDLYGQPVLMIRYGGGGYDALVGDVQIIDADGNGSPVVV